MGTGPIIHAQSLRLPLALKPLFFTYLPPNEGLGPTGCPPSYLHTLSKTDSVKLLMVTSTSSTGKKNKVQMEDAPVSNVHSLICTASRHSCLPCKRGTVPASEFWGFTETNIGTVLWTWSAFCITPQLHVINLDKPSVVVPSYMMNECQVISTM